MAGQWRFELLESQHEAFAKGFALCHARLIASYGLGAKWSNRTSKRSLGRFYLLIPHLHPGGFGSGLEPARQAPQSPLREPSGAPKRLTASSSRNAPTIKALCSAVLHAPCPITTGEPNYGFRFFTLYSPWALSVHNHKLARKFCRSSHPSKSNARSESATVRIDSGDNGALDSCAESSNCRGQIPKSIISRGQFGLYMPLGR